MKKIYSLFVALSIVLCAMANSPYFLQKQVSLEETTKAVKFDKQESRQAKVEARQAKAVAPMAINGVRQIESVQTIAKQAIPANAARKVPAKAAVEATDTVVFAAAKWKYQYYSDTGDWWMAVLDGTGTYRLDFDYIVPEENFAGTYTTEDLDLSYSYLTITDEEGYASYVDFVEATLTVTASAEGKFLTANVLCENGTRFLVTAAELPLPEAKDTVEVKYANATLVDGTVSSSTFQFWGDENGIYTSLLMYSNHVEGEYTKEDMYVDYANFILFVEGKDSTFVEFLALDLVITKENRTYFADAYALGTDTIMYHITMSYTKPAPTDTIDIVATNLYIDEFEFWGMTFCSVEASNAEYQVAFELSQPLTAGEYTTSDFDASYCGILRLSDETEIAMTEITATVTGEGKGRAIKAAVVGDDNILYNMDLSYVIPEATDTVNVVFDELAVAEYYASSGDYYIYNANENYIVTLDIFAEKGELVGEFAGEDIDLYYTQLGVIANGDTTVVTIADAKVVVSAAEEGIALIEAELLGMDAVLYKVSTKADVAEKGLQYDATEGFLVDSYTTEDSYTINNQAENGYIMFDVEAADGSDFMGLVFWVDEADEKTIIPVGTYEINGTTEFGTVLASTGMGTQGLTYSLYGTMNEEGNVVPPCWFLVGGEVVVTEKDGILKIEVDAVNSNNLVVYVTCEYDLSTKQGLQYDMTEGSLNVTYTDNDDVVVETKYLAEDGVIYLDMTAADGSHTTAVAFFAEAADPVIGIPAGTYPINDTQDYGTVMSSPGVQGDYIYPSFYGNLTANGGISIPCYFMVGGNVVVENVDDHLKVTINALNSYDVPATIVYEASGTAVENIVTGNTNNASKVVENGQLMIIKNDVKYNVLGTVVK